MQPTDKQDTAVEALAEFIALTVFDELREELATRTNPTYWEGLPEESRENKRRIARAVQGYFAAPQTSEPSEYRRGVEDAAKVASKFISPSRNAVVKAILALTGEPQ